MRTAGDPAGRPTMAGLIDRVRPLTVRSLLFTGLAMATFLAAVPCLRAYRVPGAVVLLVLAAVGSTSIAFAVAGWWRQSVIVSYSLSLVGLLALLFAACGFHPGSMGHDLVQGPSRLVTETLPLRGSRSLLATLVVLTWVCGAVTAEITVRAQRGRARSLVALVIPVAVFVICYAAGAGLPGREQLAGPALFATMAVIALATRLEIDAAAVTQAVTGSGPGPAEEASPRSRALLSGLVAVATVTVALSAVVPVLPGMSRRPASIERATPTLARVVIDPVDAMANLRDGNPTAPARDVMSVDLSRPSTGYLGMGVLDDYDGAIWRFDSTFQPTGGRIPPSGEPGVDAVSGSEIVQQVSTRVALPIPLLPAVDRPLEVTGMGVLDDPTTGMILPSGSVGAAYDYTVTSDAPSVTLAQIPAADGIQTGGDAADLETPPEASAALATTVRYLATLTGERPTATVAFMQAVAAGLHTKESRIDPDLPLPSPASTGAPTTTQTGTGPGRTGKASKGKSPKETTTTTVPAVTSFGGTSLSEVINAVTVNRAATPEQFATLYAMVARYLGVPARVVTGFRLSSSSDGGLLEPGTFEVTDRQAWAWVEIPVSGLGWVVVDPTPDTATRAISAPPEQVQAPATTVPPRQANAVPSNQIEGAHALAPPETVKVPKHHQFQVWLSALLIVVGLLALLVIAGPGQAGLRRAWRRRSRQAVYPNELAVGAWLEMLDGLTRVGMKPWPGSTGSEVAAEAGIHFGPDVIEPIAEVGALAESVMFWSAADVDPEEARRMWQLQRSVSRTLRAGLDRRQRGRSMLLVGSAPRRPSGQATR